MTITQPAGSDEYVDTIIVGAGQAGLALGRFSPGPLLAPRHGRSVDVLEAEVA